VVMEQPDFYSNEVFVRWYNSEDDALLQSVAESLHVPASS
jgi:hypothetical protein